MCDTLRTVRTKIARLLPLSTDSLQRKANLFMANYEEEKMHLLEFKRSLEMREGYSKAKIAHNPDMVEQTDNPRT